MSLYLYLCLSVLSTIHDFHVSRMVMNYNAEEAYFEVRLHVFTDDLELATSKYGSEKLRINSEFEHPKCDSFIQLYLNHRLQLQSIDGQKAQLKWLGKEATDDLQATWIYFYWVPKTSSSTFLLESSLLLDMYDDQQNIIQFKQGDHSSMNLLHKGKTNIVLKIQS